MASDVREEFMKNGVLFPVDVLNENETEFYQQKYSEYLKQYGSKGKDGHSRIRGNKIFRVHLVAKWAAELVKHPKLIEAVSQVLPNHELCIFFM